MTSLKFDEDYYEHGISKGISGYENYHWMPQRSISEAAEICKQYPIKNYRNILDFGCAKGYLVHALRLLGRNALGYDPSSYAIDNSKPEVKGNVYNSIPIDYFDLVVCKDVMEHIPEDQIIPTLENIIARANSALFVIPLGDDNKFRIREYEIDKTHVTKKDEEFWINKFRMVGYKVDEFSYNMGPIKEKWTKEYQYGNGFFKVSKR